MTALSATIGQGESQASRWVSNPEQKQQRSINKENIKY